VIVLLTAPVLQKYELPVLAVRITESPWQKMVAPDALIVAAGNAFTVTTVAADVAVPPPEKVTVTV
jgi:hypothetical protein